MKYHKKIIVFIVFFFSQICWAGAYEDFFSAVLRDDASTVVKLIERGFDPNTPDPNQMSALLLALREPSPKVAQALINTPKIDLNGLSPNGESPLMLAVFRGQTSLVQQLLEKGALVNKTGWTPLHYAATAGNIALINLLLENHAYIDAESPNKTTPLMMAAHYGTSSAVKLLLEEGADASLKNDLGLSAIDFAQNAQKNESAEIIAAFIRAQKPKGKW